MEETLRREGEGERGGEGGVGGRGREGDVVGVVVGVFVEWRELARAAGDQASRLQ